MVSAFPIFLHPEPLVPTHSGSLYAKPVFMRSILTFSICTVAAVAAHVGGPHGGVGGRGARDHHLAPQKDGAPDEGTPPNGE